MSSLDVKRLYYFGARYYRAEVGLWLSPDPGRQGANWYGYCLDNPIRYRDPIGLWAGADDIITGPVDEILVLGILGVLSLLGVKEAQDTLETVIEVIENGFNGAFSSKVEGEHEKNQGQEKRNNPLRGKPGSTSTIKDKEGNPKQTRKYAEDGYSEYDIDYDHDHGQGRPHRHRWRRPEDGSPPTHKDRLPEEPME